MLIAKHTITLLEGKQNTHPVVRTIKPTFYSCFPKRNLAVRVMYDWKTKYYSTSSKRVIFLTGNQIGRKRKMFSKFASRSVDHIFRCLVPFILHTCNQPSPVGFT